VIFIGINKLIAKSLEENINDNNQLIYPCQIVNRFECPYYYKKGKNGICSRNCIAVARKGTSKIHLDSKQDLYHALTDKERQIKYLNRHFTMYYAIKIHLKKNPTKSL
jgi:hypothetical protein